MFAVRISDNEYKMEMLPSIKQKELKAVCSPNNSKKIWRFSQKKFEIILDLITNLKRRKKQPKKLIQNEKILKLISLILLSVNSVFCQYNALNIPEAYYGVSGTNGKTFTLNIDDNVKQYRTGQATVTGSIKD
jgi:hypothetical protein